MKRRFALSIMFFAFILSALFTLLSFKSPLTAEAEQDEIVNLSSYSIPDDKLGGSIIAPYNGIAMITKTASAGETVDITLPVETSGNIAIEMKNFTKNGVTISVSLSNGTDVYSLSAESVSYTIYKSNNTAAEVTGASIALNSEGTAANGYEAFNGYVVIKNTSAITSVTVSVPLDAAEKVFIGKVYAAADEIVSNNVYDIASGKVLYNPGQTNFKYTKADNVTCRYAEKNTLVLSAGAEDAWEQSRVYLPDLESDGTFKLSDYKYLVVDADFSGRTATTSINVSFFRAAGNKYNADRLMFKAAYAVSEDGTSTKVTSTALGQTMVFPAGFKGQIYYQLTDDNMFFGANWTGDTVYNGYVFKQMMLYLNGSKNAANYGIDAKINIYFTNTNALEINDSGAYAVKTSINDKTRGTVSVDTSDGIVVTPDAYEGYQISKVLVNGKEAELTDGKLSFSSLTENKNVDIYFSGTKELSYNNNIENVTITADSEKIYNGEDVTFTIKADDNYSITSVKANGKKVNLDQNGNITFKNLTENIVFEVEIQEAGKAIADSSNFVAVSEYAGGTIWVPFNSIAVVSKTLTDTAGKTVSVTIPVATSKNIAIRINNFNRTANTALVITLKKGDTEYTLTDSSIYYLVEDGVVTEMKGASVILSGKDLGNGSYEGYSGYVIIPNENEIDAVVISADLTTAKKFFIGNIYAADSVGENYAADESAKLYTPSGSNYKTVSDENLVYVSYLEKDDYVVIGPHTGSDGWEQTRLTLPNLEEDGTFDLSKWTYAVFDCDFSKRTAQTRISFVFFTSTGKKWNADRAQSKTLIGIGEDGSYFTLDANLGGAWYIPAGFKGKLYFSVKADDMNFGANFTESVSKTTVSGQCMLYMLSQNNQGNAGVIGKLSIYFTNEILPEYETKNITVEVSDSRKGSASVNTYKTVLKGSEVTLTVTPKTGYLVDKVLVNNTEVTLTDLQYVITNIEEDVYVSVIFTNDPSMPKFNYTVTADECVTVTADTLEIPFGTDVKFTFATAFGYRIKSVKINGEAVELENDSYTLTAVEADVTIEVESEVIPELEGSSYSTELGKSYGSGLLKINALNNFYADFDSVFVSGKLYSRDVAKGICPQPYVGVELKNLLLKDYSAEDVIIIQYRQYHTQSASASGTGIKVSLFDENGVEAQIASGKPVYIIDNAISEGSVVYSNALTYVSGGMIFVPNDFSGYLVLPKTSFSMAEGFDISKVSSLLIYDDYRWWSDSGSRYAVGNILTGKLADGKVNTLVPVWNIADGTYEEYLNAMDGSSKPFDGSVSFSDFAFTERMTKGSLYFFDYTEYFSKYTEKGLTISLSDDMKANGYYDFRNVNIIRFVVDNSENDADIEFGLTITINGVKWNLNSLSKVIYYNTETGMAEYGLKEIPAGFKGYVDIYFEASRFTAEDEDAEFSPWLDKEISISLPESGASGIKNGTNLAFDIIILTSHYELEYNNIKEVTYNINYNLDGGTNNEANPSTYTALEKVTLADPVKEGYEFQGWYLSSDCSGSPITEFADTIGDISLYAKWGAHFTVTYKITGNGTVTPKKTEVESGTTLTQLIFPDDGYEIVLVKVNGKAVSLDENDSFKIENIQENITVEIVFEKEEEPEEEPGKKTTVPSTDDTTETQESTTTQSSSTSSKKKGCKSDITLTLIPVLFASAFGLIAYKKRKEE